MFSGVGQYITCDKKAIKNFMDPRAENTRRYNPFTARLNEHFSAKLHGCHIIEFPDHVLADQGHQWGLGELHYMDFYYEYGAACIEVIMRGLPDDEEKARLSVLKEKCSEKFELVRNRVNISVLRNKLKGTQNALRYFEALAYDNIANFNTEGLKGKKIALLKASDKAGIYFARVCEISDINITFSSHKAVLSQLNEAEWEKCRQCDMVISCDVHGSGPISREGMRPVMLLDMIGSSLG